MIDKDTLLEKLEALRGEPIQEFVRKEEEWNDYTEYVDATRICKKPLVSCCVFTYNQEKYIRECLDSIVAQKADFEYEVLVCEDCSTDGTLAICREFQTRYPEKVRIIHANHNYYRGALNFRRGYELARGEYIAICEGDDYWCNDKKIQLEYNAAKEKNAVAVFTDNKTLKGDQLSPKGVFEGQNLYDRIAHFTREDFIAERFGCERDNALNFATATTFIQKNILLKIKDSSFGRKRIRLGDLQIRAGVARFGMVEFLPIVSAVYRTGVGVSSAFSSGTSIGFVVDSLMCHIAMKWDIMTMQEQVRLLRWGVTGLLLHTNAIPEVRKQIRKLSLSLLPDLPIAFFPRLFVLYILNYIPNGCVFWRRLSQMKTWVR